MNDLPSIIREWQEKLKPKSTDPAVLVMHPMTNRQLAEHSTTTQREIQGYFSIFAGLKVEEDIACPRDGVVIVPHSQLDDYTRARRWVDPYAAANIAAKFAEYSGRPTKSEGHP